jgi:hypothetical protein
LYQSLKCGRLRYVGYAVILAETRNAHTILVIKSLAKWPLEKLRRRLEEDIELGRWEVGSDDKKFMEPFHDILQYQGSVLVV